MKELTKLLTNTRGNELPRVGGQRKRFVDTSPQIQTGTAGGCIRGELIRKAGIQNFDVKLHGGCMAKKNGVA